MGPISLNMPTRNSDILDKGGAFITRLASPQNDPKQQSRPTQRPGSGPSGEDPHESSSDIFIEEGATHSFEVLCPRCGVAKQGAGHWLHKPDCKCHLHCTACQRYPSARLWLCPCKEPWISCPDHRGLGFRCRGSDIVRDMTRPRKRTPPRFLETQSQETAPSKWQTAARHATCAYA